MRDVFYLRIQSADFLKEQLLDSTLSITWYLKKIFKTRIVSAIYIKSHCNEKMLQPEAFNRKHLTQLQSSQLLKGKSD